MTAFDERELRAMRSVVERFARMIREDEIGVIIYTNNHALNPMSDQEIMALRDKLFLEE